MNKISEFFPKNGKPPKTAVIMLHGVGADGENLMGLAPYFSNILQDAYFTAPNGIEKYDMNPFFDFGPCYQWFSLQDRSYEKLKNGVQNASIYIKKLIDEIKNKFSLEYKNIYLLGFSQGAMLSLHTALIIENEIGGVLAYSGALIVSDELEIKSKPPICLIHGIEDEVVPYERSKIAKEFFDKKSIKSELHSIPKLSHSIDLNGIEIGKKFFLTPS
jgi:phospholipase/carboxylesterase